MTTVCYFPAEEELVCRVSHSGGGGHGGGHGGGTPHPTIFFENPPSKLMPLPWGALPPHLKVKLPSSERQTPH